MIVNIRIILFPREIMKAMIELYKNNVLLSDVYRWFFSRIHTFWLTQNYANETMTSVNPDTAILWPRPINFTTHAVTYYEHIPVCINQRYTSLNKILFLYKSIIAFIISRGNNIILILHEYFWDKTQKKNFLRIHALLDKEYR
jgi:hypothetical protein